MGGDAVVDEEEQEQVEPEEGDLAELADPKEKQGIGGEVLRGRRGHL